MLDRVIRAEYQKCKCTGERNIISGTEKETSDLAVIEYMRYLLDNRMVYEFEDVCFCFWNISDCRAMRRNSEQEYQNHLEFSSFLSKGSDKYKFWTVCDTTQRFTLISGGYGNFWHELYREAAENTKISDENYRIAYEAHRAAMAVHPSLDIPKEHLCYADRKFSEFLESNKDREEYDFFRLIYLSAGMKAFKKTDMDIEGMCSGFYKYLAEKDTPCQYLPGEWGQLNFLRSENNRAKVGIAAAVNALIDTGEIGRAKELYQTAKGYGLPENAYINRRI